MHTKIKLAVFFGGLSPEHDVSILTGLELLAALDPTKYDAFPVYVGLDHQWWVGEPLRRRANYLPDAALKQQLTRVTLAAGNERRLGQPVLREVGAPFWRAAKTFGFEVAIPVFHGGYGEDGAFQGLLEACGVPFMNSGVTGLGLTIDKDLTQRVAASLGLPTVPSLKVCAQQAVPEASAVQQALGAAPWIVKPNRLGSSLGVHLVKTYDALEPAVRDVLRLDSAALVQRCVPNLVEYNVAVRRLPNGKVVTSQIERPLKKGDTLDFKDKYMAGGQNKLVGKLAGDGAGAGAAGMVSASRVFNPPELDAARAENIRHWAGALFAGLDLAGVPRLDFLCDSQTGELWFNEVNPIPGSMGFFLWEQATPPMGYTALLDDLVAEAQARARQRKRIDPLQAGGALFPKRG